MDRWALNDASLSLASGAGSQKRGGKECPAIPVQGCLSSGWELKCTTSHVVEVVQVFPAPTLPESMVESLDELLVLQLVGRSSLRYTNQEGIYQEVSRSERLKFIRVSRERNERTRI
ncbi:hypothetical protein J6590_065133 [Homalodisca vitripennis]|nr:hypothetical protein J6590_065133 [Homalodisca vitripennis]